MDAAGCDGATVYGGARGAAAAMMFAASYRERVRALVLPSEHRTLVRRHLATFRATERDTAGNGFMASFDGPARAIRCAQAVVDSVRSFGVEVRAGVHTGECELVETGLAGIPARVAGRRQPRRGARIEHGEGSRCGGAGSGSPTLGGTP